MGKKGLSIKQISPLSFVYDHTTDNVPVLVLVLLSLALCESVKSLPFLAIRVLKYRVLLAEKLFE